MANKRDTQQQQQQSQGQKKPTTTENKRSNEADDGAVGPSTATPSDVYEFVSTPKHSSCSSGSGDENPSKNSDKSSDDKSGTDSDTPTQNVQQKRALGDQQEPANDEISAADEEAKKKKRKDSEVKEGSKPATATNRVTSRVGQKPPGPASKTMGLVSKTATSSTAETPCEMTAKLPESETENDDAKEGPKVPPLKIVIPQQGGGSSDVQETTQSITQRTSMKQAPSRNHPYVVASSNSNDGTGSDKDVAGRGQSPSADSNKSDDAGKSTGKSKEPRILRSSRKDAKDDRGSNNSSPQLPASSTPSPAAQHADTSASNESENQQTNQNSASLSSSSNSSSTTATTVTSMIQGASQINQQQTPNPVELHPRKRKIKASSREPASVTSTADVKDSNSKDGAEKTEPVHPHDQPFTNCYQMYIDLRKQIEQRHNNLHPVEPRPLKGLEDYLMNRRTYLLQGKNNMEPNIIIPPLLPQPMKETFIEQEKERHRLKLRHIVEKEKLVLSKEQEILRVHCKAAQMIANQSQPFSVCTILKDEEVYNIITPEQEEKYRNKNRERSHGRVFYQALKELDDKYDKIKVKTFNLNEQSKDA